MQECNKVIGALEAWALNKSVELLQLAKEGMEKKEDPVEKRGVIWMGFKSLEEAKAHRENFTMTYVPNTEANQGKLHFMKNPKLTVALKRYDPTQHFVLVVSIDNNDNGSKTGPGCAWRWSVIHGDACNRITKQDLMHAPLLPDEKNDSENQISVFGGLAACSGPDCKTKATKLQRCAQCKATYYCSTECQSKHWSQHRSACKVMAGLRQAFAPPSPNGTPPPQPKPEAVNE